MNVYRVNDVAKKLGISKQTLIRYEKKGIFPHSHRNRINHWREYTEEDVQRMARIIGRSGAGFTLIEFVIVIVIVGILAVAAVPRLMVFNSTRARSAANKIASDIRSVQHLAASTHDTYRMIFDVAQDTYEVRRAGDNVYARDPFTRADFIVDLRTDPVMAGTDITGAVFGGTPGLQFNWQAVPQNTNGVDLAAEGAVSLSYKGAAATVYVRPQTGTVRIQ
ncbi:MAG: MerR family transcriptional regulator [Candidatus Omnitrophica bacterium]|nr:MerR family transcriptional regulator [Candidatus Omnitrophota bacterium]MDD5774801.1 MerR family transcriptional regulator [Candidatus Omnitrophota bacterium]